ncbi:hypothetical protein K445DRAFT_318161 [Daldinia sp. EC12]|nr:hypothetical protein K445DRAFT_318161 [Daldinia sp. EC12]
MKAFRARPVLGGAVSAYIPKPHYQTRTPSCLLRAISSKSSSSPAQRQKIAASHARPSIRPGFFTSRPYSVDLKAPESDEPPPFAFAFDIDGVLLHVAKPIPGATQTLKFLQKHNIPFILLTNGGGKHEKERVADLSARLGVELSTDNFVQSHTPFQELAQGHNGTLRDKNILVTGSDAAKCRRIAQQYGFRNVIIPADILAAHPTVWPFDPLLEEMYAKTARPLPCPDPKIDAIFVFNDPRDWALDIQIMVDLLLSKDGVLGTYSPRNGLRDLPNAGWQRDGQPELFFSNPDLFWAAGYPHPRLGQGAFQAALAGVWREVTGGAAELERVTIGKPHGYTYGFAERVLSAHRAKMLGRDVDEDGPPKPLERVYMVGDNPASDIRGANQYVSAEGTAWESVLVRTGVWNPERGGGGGGGPGGEPAYKPKVIVDDVKSAVEWALKQEGWEGGVE